MIIKKLFSAPVLYLIGFPVMIILAILYEPISISGRSTAELVGEFLAQYSMFGGIMLLSHLLLKRKFKSKKMTIVLPIFIGLFPIFLMGFKAFLTLELELVV